MSACERNAGRFPSPCLAETKTAARVLPGCTVVRLPGAVPPNPQPVRDERHVCLDLNPVCTFGENCRAGQVDCESAACYRERLISRAVNLRAWQTRVVGVEEDIENVPRPDQIYPIGVHRFDIPSLTCGNNEIIGEIGTKRREVSERRGRPSPGEGSVVWNLIVEDHSGGALGSGGCPSDWNAPRPRLEGTLGSVRRVSPRACEGLIREFRKLREIPCVNGRTLHV